MLYFTFSPGTNWIGISDLHWSQGQGANYKYLNLADLEFFSVRRNIFSSAGEKMEKNSWHLFQTKELK